jgi:probable HAF family extracellular repeat protein
MRIVGVFLFPFLVQATPLYNVVNLGSLGGASTAYAIANNGKAVGGSATPGGGSHAFQSAGGSVQDLQPGTNNSQANGVNSAGAVAGTVFTSSGARAGVWDNGIFSNFGTLGGSDSYGTGINDSAIVVGGSSLANGQGRAFLEQNGTMSNLGTLTGGNWSAAYGVNNNSKVVGSSTITGGNTRAFVWDVQNGMQAIGTLGGANSYGMGINAAGSIVGASSISSGYLHAFLYASGVLHDLGTLGGTLSSGYGINSLGQAVGYSYRAGGSSGAFLWSDGLLYDLDNYLAPNSGWKLTAAYGINDSGQIVGTGLLNGVSQAFRLDPINAGGFASGINANVAVPEPGSRSLLMIGLVLCTASVLLKRYSS